MARNRCAGSFASEDLRAKSRNLDILFLTDKESSNNLAVCQERPCDGDENFIPVGGICEEIQSDLICGVGYVILPNPYGEGKVICSCIVKCQSFEIFFQASVSVWKAFCQNCTRVDFCNVFKNFCKVPAIRVSSLYGKVPKIGLHVLPQIVLEIKPG